MYRPRVTHSSNLDMILECIFRNPGIARKEISKLTGITPATVTNTVTQMIADGMVRELGPREEDRASIGRARIALDLLPGYGYTVGVECSYTALSVCAADLRGTILYFRAIPFSRTLCSHITGQIIQCIETCLRESGLPAEKLLGIGIGVPGHMSADQQRLISTDDLWEDFNGQTIRQAFSCPVVFENNIRCIALSEYLYAPEAAPSSFTLFHVGRGMFCANMAEDSLYIGTNFGSGEIGHTTAVIDGKRCRCGKRGCLETVASEEAIVSSCIQLSQWDPNSLLHNFAASAEELTIDGVAEAYCSGDPAVRRQVRQALQYLCSATLNIAVLMNPQKLFLHGRLFNYPDIRNDLLEMIQKEFEFTGSNFRLGTVDFLPCQETDGALGGAALAIWKCLLHE